MPDNAGVTDRVDEYRGPGLDPGWLFLLAGLAMLMAVVLVPAQESLDAAKVQRDRALAIEDHRLARLERYERFRDALGDERESLVRSLAASQLNLVPEGRRPLADQWHITDASVFRELEPGPVKLPEHAPRETMLRDLTMDPRGRLWLIAGSALAILIGLLPSPSDSMGVDEPEDEDPA